MDGHVIDNGTITLAEKEAELEREREQDRHDRLSQFVEGYRQLVHDTGIEARGAGRVVAGPDGVLRMETYTVAVDVASARVVGRLG